MMFARVGAVPASETVPALETVQLPCPQTIAHSRILLLS
jgi:hypothetical protein